MSNSSVIKKHSKKSKSSVANTLILNKLKETYKLEMHEISNVINANHNKFSKFITGDKDISVKDIHSICKYFSIHPAHLLDDIFPLED